MPNYDVLKNMILDLLWRSGFPPLRKKIAMKLTSIREKYVATDNRSLWEFTQNLSSGDINCINGSKEKTVMGLFYKLIKAFSNNETPVGYLATKIRYGRQNLYLRYDYVSQSMAISSFEEIEYEIKRMVNLYLDPIIFIKDFFEMSTGSNYWQESSNIEIKEATEKLKTLAKKHNVTIFITMFFESDDVLKQYYLHFGTKGNGLIRRKTEDYYFDKQFCLNSYKDSSYKARQKLHRQFMLAHPDLKSIEKNVIVTSILGVSDILWFKFPFPCIYVGTPFIFDKQIIPENFKGYNVVRTSCDLPPKRYFTRDKSIPVEEKYSPENLRNFVENHLEYISWKLNRPELSKEEALDALTGGFKLHIDECNRRKKSSHT